jgi:hypothetical protein
MSMIRNPFRDSRGSILAKIFGKFFGTPEHLVLVARDPGPSCVSAGTLCVCREGPGPVVRFGLGVGCPWSLVRVRLRHRAVPPRR